MIDGDLQDPPELIPELVERWRAGADIVVAKRRSARGRDALQARHRALVLLAHGPARPGRARARTPATSGSSTARPLDALLRLRERSRFLRGMSSWVGFRTTSSSTTATRAARARRSTRCGKMLRFALDGADLVLELPAPARRAGRLRLRARSRMLGLPLTIVARYSGIYERGVPSLLFVGPADRRHPAARARHASASTSGASTTRSSSGRSTWSRARANLDPRGGRRRGAGRGRAPRPRSATMKVAVIGAGVAGLVCAYRLSAGGPRLRRLRALARARRPGGDDRRRRRPPARALLPPPVHERPPHRRALRRARHARRARVAAVVDGVLPRGPLVAVHDAAAPAALRAALAVLRACAWGSRCSSCRRRRTTSAPFERITAREWIRRRDGRAALREGLGPAAARQVRRPRRRHLDGVAVGQAHDAAQARGQGGAPGAARLPAALVGAAVPRAAGRASRRAAGAC